MRRRGEQTRQRLLDAGAAVLPRLGYRDTRVDDVVAAAEVSHGTFYRYFGNKDDFFRVVAATVHARLARVLEGRDFGDPATDALVLLALIERVPYSVYTLRFSSADEAIESMVTILRRGFLGAKA
jgi:AcrR family transcriptional regulator